MNRKNLIIHLLIPMIYASILLFSEICYRYTMNITSLYRISESYIILFIIVSLFYFSKTRVVRFLIGAFFVLSTLANNIHYEVYQNWINGINYLLMLREIGEVTHTGISMLNKIYPSILWSGIDCLIFFSISLFKRKTYYISDGLFILAMFYIFIRSFLTTQELGINSNPGYSRVKSNYYSFGYFIGRVLPYDFFKLSDIPIYLSETPKIKTEPKIKNIILIMGESATAKHIGALGYSRQTTPFLSSLIENYPNTLLKPAYSAGFMTAISLPTLFNAIPKPNGMEQIMSGKTNLFHLAKQQGYKTFFYSAQAETQMMIISIMGKTWIDDLRFPSKMGYDISTSINDHKILPLFYSIDLDKGNNFIVLHQRGSHTPYGELLAEDEKFFKGNTPIDNYDSTIYNTDKLIEKVFNYLNQRNKEDWVIIYTSDHGQYVSNSIYNQGTLKSSNYIVPLMIYSPNQNITAMNKIFLECKTLFHYQLSTYFIDLMGYDMPISDCKKGVINHKLLTGDAGYLEIDEENKYKRFVYPKSRDKNNVTDILDNE